MEDKYQQLLSFIKSEWMSERDFLPLHEPIFEGNEKKYLNDVIDSGFVSSVGEYVNKLENDFANYVGAKYAVAAVNGTCALQVALLMCDVEPGDEVLTQAITFVATANAIKYANAEPVFIDVEQNGLHLSPEHLENFLSENAEIRDDGFTYNKLSGKRIKACVPVHVFGLMADINKIVDTCSRYNIDVVEDAAESLGTIYEGRHSGTHGKVGVFSFNGNKIITSGGGGIIVTDNEEIAKAAKHITTTAKVPHPWKYEHDRLGFNFRMPNVNAALLCAQLEQLDHFLDKKRTLANRYHQQFNNLGIEYVGERKGEKTNFWLINLLLGNEKERDEFLEIANNSGVMTRPIWTLMTDLEMYKSCLATDLSNSKYMMNRVVNIPSSANLT